MSTADLHKDGEKAVLPVEVRSSRELHLEKCACIDTQWIFIQLASEHSELFDRYLAPLHGSIIV